MLPFWALSKCGNSNSQTTDHPNHWIGSRREETMFSTGPYHCTLVASKCWKGPMQDDMKIWSKPLMPSGAPCSLKSWYTTLQHSVHVQLSKGVMNLSLEVCTWGHHTFVRRWRRPQIVDQALILVLRAQKTKNRDAEVQTKWTNSLRPVKPLWIPIHEL